MNKTNKMNKTGSGKASAGPARQCSIKSTTQINTNSGVPRGGGLECSNPPPAKFRRPSKIMPNSTRFVKTVKNC